MVHQDVPLADRVEDAAVHTAEPRRRHRDERRIVQLGDVDRGQFHQVAQLEQRAHFVHVAVGERRVRRQAVVAQLVQQQRARLLGHAGLDLDAHHFAEATPEHLLLDRREQVIRLFGRRQLDVRVARDPEGVPVPDLHPREERAQVRADHLLERHEVVRATGGHPARQALGHLHAREVRRVGDRIADLERQREREVRDVREGVPRVHRERREHREDVRLEERVDRGPLGAVQFVHGDQADPVAFERRQDVAVQAPVALPDQGTHPLGDQLELLRRRHPVRRAARDAGRELPPQARDPHHVELVEIGAEDRQELQALEQRHALVQRLVQHPGVELQPTQLAVEIEFVRGECVGHRPCRRQEAARAFARAAHECTSQLSRCESRRRNRNDQP